MSAPLSASVDAILDRFDEAWNDPTPPRIKDYLKPTDPAKRLALLMELVHIDLERRLARGERIRLEEAYLPRNQRLGKTAPYRSRLGYRSLPVAARMKCADLVQ